MKSIKIAISIIVYCLMLQCKSDIAKTQIICNDSTKVSLQKSNSIKAEVLAASFKYGRVFFDNLLNQEILVAYQAHNHQLIRFDIDREKELEPIVLESLGPVGISKNLLDFYYVNQDSIYFLNHGVNKIYLLKKQTGIEVTDLSMGLDNFYNGFTLMSMPDSHLRLDYDAKNHLVYTFIAPFIDYDEELFFDYPFYAKIDLESQKIVHTYGKYPYAHGERPIGLDPAPSIVNTGMQTIVSFSCYSNLLVYDNASGEKIKEVCGNSIYFDNDLPFYNKSWDFQKQVNYFIENPFFISLLYDRHRNCYYRFAKHKQSLKNAESKLNTPLSGKLSVLIFNEELEKIGETILPENTYYPKEVFITRKGLWIQNMKEETEEYNVFDLFKLDKNSKDD